MLTYLASPYTHRSRRVENMRAKAVTYVAAKLVCQGYHIFSPIVHNHQMNRLCNLGGKFEYWEEFDKLMLGLCSGFWIVMLPDWDASVGINAETLEWRRRGERERYIHPITLEITREPERHLPSLNEILHHWKANA